MTEWKCHHGFTFAQACKQCELETARAFWSIGVMRSTLLGTLLLSRRKRR